MFNLIEALNYRCLRYISCPLGPFHVIVGPNASGKTTFLDTIGFLRDLVNDGLETAISIRTQNPEELLFRRHGKQFELAIEAKIPDNLRKLTARPDFDIVRYEVAIGFDETKMQFEFKAEKLLLKKGVQSKVIQRTIFPSLPDVPQTLQTPKGKSFK